MFFETLKVPDSKIVDHDNDFSDDMVGQAVAILLGVSDENRVDMYTERWLLPLNPEGLSPPESLDEAGLRKSCETILSTYRRELARQEQNPLPGPTKKKFSKVFTQSHALSATLAGLEDDEIRILFGADVPPEREELRQIKSLTASLSESATPEEKRLADGIKSLTERRLSGNLSSLSALADLAWKRLQNFNRTRPTRLLSMIDTSAETRLVMMSGQLFTYASIKISSEAGHTLDRFLNLMQSAAGVDTSSEASFSNRIFKYRKRREICIYRARALARLMIGTEFAPGLRLVHLQTPTGEISDRLRLGLGTFLSMVNTDEQRQKMIEWYGQDRVTAADELLSSFDALNGKPVAGSD